MLGGLRCDLLNNTEDEIEDATDEISNSTEEVRYKLRYDTRRVARCPITWRCDTDTDRPGDQDHCPHEDEECLSVHHVISNDRIRPYIVQILQPISPNFTGIKSD